jgi:uncharacterized protein YbjQ (UPF0145 family)/predicted RNA-binding Zn-ribbon protein involved in translation (DUF1610 family)
VFSYGSFSLRGGVVGKVCLKCDYERKPEDRAPDWQCPNCEAVYSKIEEAVKKGIDVKKPQLTPKRELSERLSTMIVTTTPTLPGAEVDKVLGIVAGDSTYAFSSINEFFGSIGRAVAGSGQSYGTESHLVRCREEALKRLRFNAANLGADAVIGVSVNVVEFSGATDNGVVVISATGTAVKVVG